MTPQTAHTSPEAPRPTRQHRGKARSEYPARKCPVTLEPIEEPTGRGRPPEFSSEEAGELFRAITRIRSALKVLKPRMGPQARAKLRGELWLIGNSLTLGGYRRSEPADAEMEGPCEH